MANLDWANMKLGDLREFCAERDLPKSGAKAVLLVRLKDSQEPDWTAKKLAELRAACVRRG